MRTARAGIGQRSAGMTTPSDWAGTRRGATMPSVEALGRERGEIPAHQETGTRARGSSRSLREKRDKENDKMGDCGNQPILFHLCHALVCLFSCSPDLTRHREHSLVSLDSFQCDCLVQVADQKSTHSCM